MLKRNSLDDRLYQRGRVWWFWGWDYRDVRYQTSTHQTERRAALDYARAEERRRAIPPDPTAAKPAALALTLGAALKLLYAADARNGNSARTLEIHQNRGRHLVAFFGANCLVAPSEFGIADRNRYIDDRLGKGAGTDTQRHTIAQEIGTLVQCLYEAKANGLYDGDPSVLRGKFSPARYYRPGTGWLRTAEHCNALVAEVSAPHPRSRAPRIDRRWHVIAYLHAGVRRNELYLIKPEHVHMAKRYVEVDGRKTDGAKRNVPMSDTLYAAFDHLLKGAKRGVPLFTPWSGCNRDIADAWARVVSGEARSGVQLSDPPDALATLPRRISFNDLRRTFCSLMAAAGVPLHHCADLLGHADLKMVMQVYRQVCPEALHDAVKHLPALTLPALELPTVAAGTVTDGQRISALGRAGT